MGGRRLSFNDRQVIESLIKRSTSVIEIARQLRCHRDTIYKELRNGMLPEDYAAHKYWMYSALVAQCGLVPDDERQAQSVTEADTSLQVSFKV
ncbi:helix-turn-helix domain-containing protein [Ihubacter sp. mB4P-1]|uniref:helix-turn-helix domain-containing protein n=1 Tax=Ihubacter sp. mB4P-1 TaxID=3242370 RepID=UPI003C7CA4EB